jgi:hypothetical protein
MTKRFLVPIGTDHVDFNLINDFEDSEGRLRWNRQEGTLDLGMPGGVTQTLGMSFYMPPTKNNSGVEIAKGSFVMATGAQGDRITIAKAVTDGSVDPMFMIGIAAETIAIGSEDGLIITNGLVKGISTSSWNVGTVLYPDPATAGGLISTKPNAPNIRTPIAIVLRQDNNNGRIYIRMTNGSTFGGTDSNVDFDNPQAGQVVIYDGVNDVWTNDTAPPAVTPTGPVLPESGTNGLFFYNTTSDKLYFFFNQWKEVTWNEIAALDGGTSATTEFDIQVDGGDASTLTFAGTYDNGDSATQF